MAAPLSNRSLPTNAEFDDQTCVAALEMLGWVSFPYWRIDTENGGRCEDSIWEDVTTGNYYFQSDAIRCIRSQLTQAIHDHSAESDHPPGYTKG